MDEKTQTTFDGDASATLGVKDVSCPTDENRDKLHRCSKDKGEGIRNPILIRALDSASGGVVWKKRKKTVPIAKQPEAGYNTSKKIKGEPGDDEEGEGSKAKSPQKIEPWKTKVEEENHYHEDSQGSGQGDPMMKDHHEKSGNKYHHQFGTRVEDRSSQAFSSPIFFKAWIS